MVLPSRLGLLHKPIVCGAFDHHRIASSPLLWINFHRIMF
jgi:hypothetical protein